MHCIMFTIYTGLEPKPDKFVVVPFIVGAGGQGDQLEILGIFESLKQAREAIPSGNVRLETNEHEHPSIVESWADRDDINRGALAIMLNQTKRETQA